MADEEEPGLVTDPGAAELGQISAFLLRPEVGAFRDALRNTDLEPIPVAPGMPFTGELYVAETQSPEPGWLPFARRITGAPIAFLPTTRLSAVLFIDRGNYRGALTFGYGRLLLRRDAVEPDFGLKVAAGLVDPEQLASVDARSLDATTIQVRRQSSRGVQPQAIGFDVSREMLRGLAGRLQDETVGTRILGSDSVGLTSKLSTSTLAPRLDLLHEAYASAAYRRRFDHIDRWSRVERGPVRERLDDELIRILTRRRAILLEGDDPDALPGSRPPVLEAPEVIDYRGSGFRTSPEQKDERHPFPDLDAYLAAGRRDPTVLDLTRNHDLELIADESSDVRYRWPIYGCLNWEMELDDSVYVLVEGTWWRIAADYRTRIDAFVGAIPQAKLDRPDFDPREWEVDYNERLAAYVPGRGFLDRRVARFVHETGTVEPCDVFTPERQFVHVKPETSSAALSHLFGQGLVSSRLFLQLPEFREELRRLLKADQDLVKLVPKERPDPRDFEVVYAIVTNAADPINLSLPFFSRNYLSRVAQDVESMGYRVALAGIPERHDARPADAGPLFRERAAAKAEVVTRSTRGQRRPKVTT